MVSVLGSNHIPSEPGDVPLHLRSALHPELIQSHVHASLSHSPKGKRSSCRRCFRLILCSPLVTLNPLAQLSSLQLETLVWLLWSVRFLNRKPYFFMQITLSVHSARELPQTSIFNNYGTALRKEQQWAYHCKSTGLILHSILLPPFRDLCAVSFAYTNGKIKLPDKGRVARTTIAWVPPSTF